MGESMSELTELQTRVYEFLRKEIIDNGLPPSVREICASVGIKSTSTVHSILKELEREGYILRDPLLKRAIRLPEMETAKNYVQVPLLGTVTAGVPILAVEQIEGYVPYSGTFSKDKEYFALKVRGDSMINAAICDEDVIICEKTPIAENGEIIVALIDDEATVKRFYKENGGFRLQPENDNYEPIYSNELLILGKVIALTRTYY